MTIIEGKAIVYRIGRRLFVNTPEEPSRLRDDDILITRSFNSQLCNHDLVNLVGRDTRIQHGYLMLGKFVPYSKVPKGR